MAEAASQDTARFYVPEIHDVHPGMEGELDALLEVWPQEARPHLAMLIVPNWQGRFPFAAAPAFADRVAALPGEKVLHGWTHSLGPDFWNWLLYGHDNRSEFARLDRDEAGRRIAAGVDAFASLFGAAPRWFCAPRWHQSPAATEALREAGFEGYMLRGSLRLFSGVEARLHALCFDEGDRKLKSALMRRVREWTIDAMVDRGRPFRITLHPNDVKDAPTWRQVRRTMERLGNEGWMPLSLDEAVKSMQAATMSGAGKVAAPR
jgi:predicted deacetylase